MQDRNPIPPFNQDGAPQGVCVVDGHGIKIKVERRHLVVEDGIGRSRRERRFHKATGDLKRIVILGTTGYLSLEAVRWLADANIPITHIDTEGRSLVASQPLGSDRPALRRAQALALSDDTGMQIIRYLLDRKLEGQAHIASQLGGDRDPIDEANRSLEQADTLNELMWLEAQAANHYWYAWTNVECRFIKRDEHRVPYHWRTFGKRASSFGGSGSHNAANPINAILNYLYALLESETVIALQTVGLDPGVGILHVDKRARDSFALDVMEPVRPLIDQWVLQFLNRHRFKAADFADTRRGTCRISPTLTHYLAETTNKWADAVRPHGEAVARLLSSTVLDVAQRVPTPPTDITVSTPPARRNQAAPSAQPSHCHTCGQTVARHRTQCDECLAQVRGDLPNQAHERLEQLRDEDNDPAHGGEAAAKRGQSVEANNRASYEWNRTNERLDPAVFIEEIFPLLQDVSLSSMSEATGLSRGYCSFIRRGLKVPHERHWPALRQISNREADL